MLLDDAWNKRERQKKIAERSSADLLAKGWTRNINGGRKSDRA